MHCCFTTAHSQYPSMCNKLNLSNNVTDVEMDETLWSKLPDALVDCIAASLPLPSLFRFRTVCKRFESNMSRESFLDHCDDVGTDAPYFLMLVEGPFGMVGLTYSLVFKKWYKMPFPVLNHSLSKFDIVASAGGLLCLRNRENSSLVVCNPITNSSRELPPLHSTRIAFEAGMVMDSNGKDYRIIVWRYEQTGPVTKVYSSKTNQWALKRSVQLPGDVLSDSGVICGDYFYILVINEYICAFSYCIDEDRWQELQAPMPNDILYGYLVNRWGSLLLVGAIGKNFPIKGIAMWKLDLNRMAWVYLLSMPTDLFDDLTINFEQYDAFNCAGQGDYICFLADRHSKALIYDFQSNSWQWTRQSLFAATNRHLVPFTFKLNAKA